MAETITCPKCGSAKIVKAGFAIRRGGNVQSYRCRDCGHAFIEKNGRKESGEPQ